MKRGEIWWANLRSPWGRRPVLLLSRDEAYTMLTWVVAAPITTNMRSIPTAVALSPEADRVERPCTVTLDNMQLIRRNWLDAYITSLGSDRMLEVERAIHFALRLSF